MLIMITYIAASNKSEVESKQILVAMRSVIPLNEYYTTHSEDERMLEIINKEVRCRFPKKCDNVRRRHQDIIRSTKAYLLTIVNNTKSTKPYVVHMYKF